MPRKFLNKLDKGDVYQFAAGDRNSGTVNVAFGNNAGQHDQTSIVVTLGSGAQRRRDKLEAGTSRAVSAGMYDDIVSIRNVGPSTVELSLTW